MNICKDACMDVLMALIRTGKSSRCRTNTTKSGTHLTDNKRVQMFKNGELVFTWVKTLKLDHYHMALLYALVASRILGVSDDYGTPLPLLSTFQVRPR